MTRAARLLEPHVVEATPMQGALRPEVSGMLPTAVRRPVTAFFPYSPVVGPLNPVAPPIRLHFDGERMTGTTVLERLLRRTRRTRCTVG